jgi:hypothetical protein
MTGILLSLSRPSQEGNFLLFLAETQSSQRDIYLENSASSAPLRGIDG